MRRQRHRPHRHPRPWPPRGAARRRCAAGRKVWRISFLALLPGEDKTTLMQALLDRLHELGYSEGKNMIFEYRSAEGRPERLPPLALDLVHANPDVLIAGLGTLTAQAAQAATTTIPIVFVPLVIPSALAWSPALAGPVAMSQDSAAR